MRNPVRRQIKNGIGKFCGNGVKFRMHSLYNLDKATWRDCESSSPTSALPSGLPEILNPRLPPVELGATNLPNGC